MKIQRRIKQKSMIIKWDYNNENEDVSGPHFVMSFCEND